jgi:hypothetical protein
VKREHGYRLLLRWAALPVTDRRWGATLAAIALGFGLFVGVAIGPGASGSVAGDVPRVIEVAGLGGGGGGGGGEEEASGFETAAAEEPFEAEPEAAESGFDFTDDEAFEEPAAASEEPSAPATEPEPEDEPDDEPEAELIALNGVVVHANPAAGSYTVAEASGALSAVHAAELPRPGTKVNVPVRTLANGTLAEGGARKRIGTAPAAELEGVVSYVDADPAAPAYAVSKRGVSVLVRVRPDPTGAAAQLPLLGAFARVGVEIDHSAESVETPPSVPPVVPAPESTLPQPLCEGVPPPAPEQLPRVPAPVATLWQTSLDASGVPFTYSDIAGVVIAVCAQEGRLLISADDLREAGADLSIAVPPKLDTAELEPGDSVLATAEIGAGGELTLKGLASDEHAKGADDAGATQGDLVNHLDR